MVQYILIDPSFGALSDATRREQLDALLVTLVTNAGWQ